jgi:hypothetical protein
MALTFTLYVVNGDSSLIVWLRTVGSNIIMRRGRFCFCVMPCESTNSFSASNEIWKTRHDCCLYNETCAVTERLNEEKDSTGQMANNWTYLHYPDYILLERDTMQSGREVLTLQMNPLFPPPRLSWLWLWRQWRRLLWNANIYLPDYMVSHPRRT